MQEYMGESDYSDSSIRYSSSDSEGDENFTRVRTVRQGEETRFRNKRRGWGKRVPVRSAIEHDHEDPQAGVFKKKLRRNTRTSS